MHHSLLLFLIKCHHLLWTCSPPLCPCLGCCRMVNNLIEKKHECFNYFPLTHPIIPGFESASSRWPKNWRMWVSIPLPLACKASALPLELIPLPLGIDVIDVITISIYLSGPLGSVGNFMPTRAKLYGMELRQLVSSLVQESPTTEQRRVKNS